MDQFPTSRIAVLIGERFGLPEWRTWVFGMARGVSVVWLVLMWLIFFPPHSYLRWVLRRYAQARP